MILPSFRLPSFSSKQRQSTSPSTSGEKNPAANTILATNAAASSTQSPPNVTVLGTLGSKISNFFSGTLQSTSAPAPLVNRPISTSPDEPSEQLSPNDPYSYLKPKKLDVQTVSLLIDGQQIDVQIPPNFKGDCCKRLKHCFSINGVSVIDLLKGKTEEQAESHLLTLIYLQLPSELTKEEKINLLQNIAKTMTQSTLLSINEQVRTKLYSDHKLDTCKVPENINHSIELLINQNEIQVSASSKCIYTEKLGQDAEDGWVKLDRPIRAEGSVNFSFAKNGRLTISSDVTTKILPVVENLSAQFAPKKRSFIPGEHLSTETIQQFNDGRSTQGPFVQHYYGTTEQNVYLMKLQKDLTTPGVYRRHLTNVISALETRHQAEFHKIIGPLYFAHFNEYLQGDPTFGSPGTEKPVWTRIVPKDPNEPVILKCEARMIIRDIQGAPLPEDLIRTATVKTTYIINNLGEVEAFHDAAIQTQAQ